MIDWQSKMWNMPRAAFVCIALLSLVACAGDETREQSHDHAQSSRGGSSQSEQEVQAAIEEIWREEIFRLPTDPDVIYHVLAGEYLGGEEDLAGAARQYVRAASKSIEPAVAARASRISYATEDWASLYEATSRWLVLEPANDDAIQLRAIAQMQRGHAAGAITSMRAILKKARSSEAGWGTVAGLMAAVGDEEKVNPVLDGLLAMSGEVNSDAELYGRSVLAYRMQRPQVARQLAEQAARQTDNIEILRWAAQVAHAQGDGEAALAHYRHALTIEPGERDLTLAYAEVLRRQQRLDEALRVLDQLPADSSVLYTAGVYAESAGRRDDTLAYYRRLRKLDEKGDSQHFYYCGQLAEVLLLHDDAVKCFRRVTDGDYVSDARIRLGYALASGGNVLEATEILRLLQGGNEMEVVEQAFIAEAQILRDAGQLDRALDRLSEGLSRMNDSVNLLYARALLAEAMGELSWAEQDLRTIIQNDPDNAVALNALGYTLANRTNRYEEALSLIERAMVINPEDAATLDSLGWVYYRMGKPGDAVEYLRRALENDKNAEIAAHLGEVLWQLGRHQEALDAWREGARINAQDAVLLETLERFGVTL